MKKSFDYIRKTISTRDWLKGASAVWLYRLTSGICSFISVGILTRWLGVEGYSQFLVIFAAGGVLSVLDLGLPAAVQNEMALTSPDKRIGVLETYLSMVLRYGSYSIIISAILGFFAFNLYSSSLDSSLFSRCVFSFIAVGFCLLFTFTGYVKILVGQGHAARGFVFQSIGIVLVTAITFLYARIVTGVTPIIAVALILFVQIIWAFFCWLKNVVSITGFSVVGQSPDKRILAHGVQFSLFGIQLTVLTAIIYAVLKNFVSAEALILYFLCDRISSLTLLVSMSPLISMSPKMSQIISQKDVKAYYDLLKQYLLFSIPICVIGYLAFVVLRGPIFNILSAGKIQPASVITIFLFFINSCVGIWIGFFSTSLQACKKVKILTAWGPLSTFITLVLLFFLGPVWGTNGAVVAISAANILFGVWFLPKMVFKELRIS